MTSAFDLVIRNACSADGLPLSIGIRAGRIAALGTDVEGRGPEIDAGGRTAGPGLHDHHLHLLATAARMGSIDLAGCRDVDAIVQRLRGAAGGAGEWVRAIGYDERVADLPDAAALDTWLADRPLRVQDRTGACWLLNSMAIERLGGPPFPASVEIGPGQRPTGRIRRGDAWLRSRIGGGAPSLAPLGQRLAQRGITGVTDASASNGPDEAEFLAGSIPQRLILMGSEALGAGDGYALGPVKLLFDESDLPPVDAIAGRIGAARALGRNVAAHCVTLGELVVYLAALDAAGGARAGDRIEHGSVIPASLIPDIAAAGLIVVTQPNFIHDRGDRYLAELDASELADLYRLRSLIDGGVAMLGGSDAPYGDPDPWIALRAATDRRTRSGALIGASEAVDRMRALSLYGPAPLCAGMPADLILYDWPVDPAAPVTVALTVIGGEIVWQA
jgi:predicted amidohydrolase YtcJ